MKSRSWLGFFSQAAATMSLATGENIADHNQGMSDPEHDLTMILGVAFFGLSVITIGCCIKFCCRPTQPDPVETREIVRNLLDIEDKKEEPQNAEDYISMDVVELASPRWSLNR